jgi:hypothetical protein
VLLGGGTGGAGMTVSPSRVPAAGPFTFLVTGAVCSRTIQYTFQVAAVYPGGQAASAATTPVQPCVAPGPPTGLASAIASHQISLSWAPPASDGGSPVTYKVWWNGAVTSAMDVTGPSATITGLTNFSTYAIRVDAINGAGSASATLSVVLAGPSRGYGTTTYSGTYPQHFVYGSPSDSPVVGAQPLGGGVTVTCQELGATVKAVGGPSSSMQDRITGFGGAYLPDVFVLTPDNGTDSYSAPLWPCI